MSGLSGGSLARRELICRLKPTVTAANEAVPALLALPAPPAPALAADPEAPDEPTRLRGAIGDRSVRGAVVDGRGVCVGEVVLVAAARMDMGAGIGAGTGAGMGAGAGTGAGIGTWAAPGSNDEKTGTADALDEADEADEGSASAPVVAAALTSAWTEVNGAVGASGWAR